MMNVKATQAFRTEAISRSWHWHCDLLCSRIEKQSLLMWWASRAWDCVELWLHTKPGVPSFHRERSLPGCSPWAGTCTGSGTLQWSQRYHGSFLPVHGNTQLQTAPGWPPRNSENLWWAMLSTHLFTLSLSVTCSLQMQTGITQNFSSQDGFPTVA